MPRRYDDDDDDDRRSVRKEPLSGMDGMYANTSFPILIIFSLCCNGLCLLPLILSVIGVATCKDPTAQSNAKICLIISGVMTVIGIVAQIARIAMEAGGGGRGF